jgi:broad specificity phosphatase PhoE
MTRLLLIRHGQTDAVDRYLSGTAAGVPLNEKGRAQVAQLAAQLHDVPLAAVASSPLTRTRETAEPIAGDHVLTVQAVAGLTEYDVGQWTGRTFRDLDADPEWRRFNAVRSLVRPPGGELMIEVQQRAVSALFDLAAQHTTGTIAVVSHADVIRAALLFFLGVPIDLLHRIEIAPARISIVTLDGCTPTVTQVNGDSVPTAD